MANSVDPDQTAPLGAVCCGSTLFASILNLCEDCDTHEPPYLQSLHSKTVEES